MTGFTYRTIQEVRVNSLLSMIVKQDNGKSKDVGTGGITIPEVFQHLYPVISKGVKV